MSRTQLSSEIDLHLDGKQSGYLRLPHSVHRSAYGWIPIPIVSIANGDGPTVLLMGGNHGDEFEGQVALSELAKSLEPENINGQLIILPQANAPASQAGKRTSPIDEGNLNRCFPGDPMGTPTQMIAHYIESVLLPKANYLFDIHSGGTSLVYKPTLLIADTKGHRLSKQKRALLDSFGFPKALVYRENKLAGYSSSAAQRNKVIGITAEMAGGGNVNPAALQVLRAGLMSALSHVGLLTPSDQQISGHQTQCFETPSLEYMVHARDRGVFEPLVDIDDQLTKGQAIATIHQPDKPWLEAQTIVSNVDATVICKRALALVECGDCLFELARPYQR